MQLILQCLYSKEYHRVNLSVYTINVLEGTILYGFRCPCCQEKQTKIVKIGQRLEPRESVEPPAEQ